MSIYGLAESRSGNLRPRGTKSIRRNAYFTFLKTCRNCAAREEGQTSSCSPLEASKTPLSFLRQCRLANPGFHWQRVSAGFIISVDTVVIWPISSSGMPIKRKCSTRNGITVESNSVPCCPNPSCNCSC